jgi:thioredoxin reductase
MYDTIIVGAGPAGLSAALVLGRCCRRVLVCDAGQPRNAASPTLHGFLTRDGLATVEFQRLGREQLLPYPSVELRTGEMIDAIAVPGGFEVVLHDSTRHAARTLLLATGLRDEVPAIEGLQSLYGQSVFPCAYCDGWEVRDQPLAAYGPGLKGFGLAILLTAWSRDIVLCTDGPANLPPPSWERLAVENIPVREEQLLRLEGTDGQLERLVFADGQTLARRALFFGTGHRQQSDLAAKLGCRFTPEGGVQAEWYQGTNVPGLFVAGDASSRVHLAIVAAAEGAKAAYAINMTLLNQAKQARRT